MKALLLILALTVNVFAQDPQWELVSTGTIPDSFKPREVKFYFDTASIKRDEDVIRVTVKIAFPGGPGTAFQGTTLAGMPVFSILSPVRFDCAKNTITSDESKALIYDDEGIRLVPKRKVKGMFGQPSKDRAAHYLWEYVCERATTLAPKGLPTLKRKP